MALPLLWQRSLLGAGVVAAHIATRRRESLANCREVPWWEESIKKKMGVWNPQRRLEEQSKVAEHRKYCAEMEATKKEHFRVLEADNAKVKAENAGLEVDKARLGVDNTVLSKIIQRLEQEGAQKNAKINDLEDRLRLGSDRLTKVLSTSESRQSHISSALKQAVPSLGLNSARQMAVHIDSFEDFQNPDALRAEVKDDVLHVFSGAPSSGKADNWQLRFGLHNVDQVDRPQLEKAVKHQIDEQKKLFGVRHLLQQTCEAHLSKSLAMNGQPLTLDCLKKHFGSLSHREAEVERRRLVANICKDLQGMFQVLDDAGDDVQKVLLSAWQPLVLQHTLWVFMYLNSMGIQGSAAGEEIPHGDRQKIALSLYDAWELLKARGVSPAFACEHP